MIPEYVQRAVASLPVTVSKDSRMSIVMGLLKADLHEALEWLLMNTRNETWEGLE